MAELEALVRRLQELLETREREGKRQASPFRNDKTSNCRSCRGGSLATSMGRMRIARFAGGSPSCTGSGRMNPLNLWKALIAHGYKEAAAGLLADLIGDLLTAEALAPPNVEQRFGEMTRGYLSDVLQDAGDGHRVAVFVDAFCRDRGEFDRLSHSHAAEMIEGFEQLKP